MFCENCGSQMSEGTKFCENCGSQMTQAPVQNVAQPIFAQNAQPQQPFTPVQPVNPYYAQNNSEPLTVGNYMVMMLILTIPIVNIIMSFVWAFGGNVNQNKKNYARAMLIFMLIGIVIWIAMFAFFGSVFTTSEIMNNHNYSDY